MEASCLRNCLFTKKRMRDFEFSNVVCFRFLDSAKKCLEDASKRSEAAKAFLGLLLDLH